MSSRYPLAWFVWMSLILVASAADELPVDAVGQACPQEDCDRSRTPFASTPDA